MRTAIVVWPTALRGRGLDSRIEIGTLANQPLMDFSSNTLRNRLLPIACSQGVGVACGVLGVKIVSRIVEPAVLGRYGIFLSFVTVGMWFVHAGVIRHVSRNWATAEDRGYIWRGAWRAWLRKLRWLALCAVLISAVAGRGNVRDSISVFVPLLLASSFLSLAALTQTALQAGRAHWADFAVSAVGSITRTFGPPILYLVSGSILVLYGSYCLHALCFAGAGLLILKVGRFRAVDDGVSERLDPIYDGPLFSGLALANWALTGVTRWIVVWQFGETTAGQFTLAGSIGLIVPAVLNAVFLQYCQPGFFSIVDGGAPDARQRLGRYVDAVVVLLAVVGAAGLLALRLLAPMLIGVLIDAKYVQALNWIVPAGCFGLAVAMAQFYHVMMVAIRRERACAPVDLGTAAVLVLGAAGAAMMGEPSFQRSLLAAPLVVLLLTRGLARHYLFKNQPA